MIKAFSILLAALFLGVAPISASANLLGVTFDNQLISIDTTTGAGSLIGNLDSEMSAFGLADYNGSVYTFDQRADLIRQIDISSGDTLNSFDIGIGDIVGEGSLTFANNGTGYLTTSSDTSGKLYSFDIVTGKSELISDVLGSFDGMDFNNTGMLYGKRQYPPVSG